MGMTNPDKNGKINYKAFSFKVKSMVDELFNLDQLDKIANMISNGIIKQEQIEEVEMTKLDLFKMFKKYDKNLNGVLEISEYIDCLRNQDVEFTESEIITLALMADINGDNAIDYEEFMKHFRDMLKRVRFMKVITSAVSDSQKQDQTPIEKDQEAEKD